MQPGEGPAHLVPGGEIAARQAPRRGWLPLRASSRRAPSPRTASLIRKWGAWGSIRAVGWKLDELQITHLGTGAARPWRCRRRWPGWGWWYGRTGVPPRRWRGPRHLARSHRTRVSLEHLQLRTQRPSSIQQTAGPAHPCAARGRGRRTHLALEGVDEGSARPVLGMQHPPMAVGGLQGGAEPLVRWRSNSMPSSSSRPTQAGASRTSRATASEVTQSGTGTDRVLAGDWRSCRPWRWSPPRSPPGPSGWRRGGCWSLLRRRTRRLAASSRQVISPAAPLPITTTSHCGARGGWEGSPAVESPQTELTIRRTGSSKGTARGEGFHRREGAGRGRQTKEKPPGCPGGRGGSVRVALPGGWTGRLSGRLPVIDPDRIPH